MEDDITAVPRLEPGERLARYVVLKQLGGSGNVYAAHDPELDRKVALRLIPGGDADTLRQAQATAGLSHANVIAVHDVGTFEGGVFVAMEYMEGETLGGWTAQHRSWREIRDGFVQVAKGLRAAHGAGLACGRPTEQAALIDEAGRVRVGDLKQGDTQSTTTDQKLLGEALSRALDDSAHPDAVPTWLRKAASSAQADDYVDLEDLIGALSRDQGRPRRVWPIVAAVTVAAVAAAIAYERADAAHAHACADAERKLDGVWDQARRQEMESAFSATALPYAGDAFREAAGTLDDYAAGWTSTHRETCEATHVRRQQSARVLDLRMECLQRRLDQLDALTTLFATADADVVERAARAAQSLAVVEDCSDLDRLVADVPPPPDAQMAEQVEQLRAELDRAGALQGAGKYGEGVGIVAGVATRAEELDYAPLHAEALVQLGELQDQAGNPSMAEATLERGLDRAWRGGFHRIAAGALIELAHVSGESLGRFEEAERYARHALAAVERVGNDDLMRAEALFALATVMNGQARYEEAIRRYEEVLALREHVGGDSLASTYNNIALAHHALGRHEQALANYGRALEIWERTLGPEHPAMATIHNNLGSTYYAQDRLEEARTEMLRGYEIRRAVLGVHPRVAESLNNVGVVEFQMGRYDDAEARQREALRIREETVGADHPDVAPTLLTLGRILHMRGEREEAANFYYRALELTEGSHGPDHPYVGAVSHAIAEMLVGEEKYEEALKYRRRGLAINEGTLGPGHPRVASSLRMVAEILVELKRPAEALAPLDRSVQILESHPQAAEELARTQFVLARALWNIREDRPRALTLARQAKGGLSDRPDDEKEVAAWLAARD